MASEAREEKKFSRHNAIWASIRNVARNIGPLVLGNAVLVPVRRVTYESRVERLIAADSSYGDENTIVDTALRKSLLTMGDGHSFEEFHFIPNGTIWDRGGHTRDWDAILDAPNNVEAVGEQPISRVLE